MKALKKPCHTCGTPLTHYFNSDMQGHVYCDPHYRALTPKQLGTDKPLNAFPDAFPEQKKALRRRR
jgi:hypothetical protein